MPWRFIARRDLLAIVLGAVLIVVLAFVYVKVTPAVRKANGGFGPEWECENPGRGDPICIKKPVESPAPRGAEQP